MSFDQLSANKAMFINVEDSRMSRRILTCVGDSLEKVILTYVLT